MSRELYWSLLLVLVGLLAWFMSCQDPRPAPPETPYHAYPFIGRNP